MIQDSSSTAFQTVEKLKRIHNVLILLTAVFGMTCVAVVNATHIFPTPPDYLWLLNAACIAAPILAMVLTAVSTNLLIKSSAAKFGDAPPTPDSVAPVFFRSKLVSMLLLTLAGLFAGACLLVGHRTRDVIFALIPAILLVATRPSHGNVEHFVILINLAREARFGLPRHESADNEDAAQIPSPDKP